MTISLYLEIVNLSLYGVPIEYKGQWSQLTAPNWPLAYKYSEVVEHAITKDIIKGQNARPFFSLPFENSVDSLMGTFPQKRSTNKYCVINDLLWLPGQSVNK